MFDTVMGGAEEIKGGGKKVNCGPEQISAPGARVGTLTTQEQTEKGGE